MNYNRTLAELQELLRKADVLSSWDYGHAASEGENLRVDFKATISIRANDHGKPSNVRFNSAQIDLVLIIKKDGGLADIKECAAEVLVKGTGPGDVSYLYALHFDRHPPEQHSNDLHARFHWQVGGDRLAEQEFGTVLHLPAPRFPSHPLDPILLVDFVLGHFYGERRMALVDDPKLVRYRRLLSDSQTKFVTPFFVAIIDALNANPVARSEYWPALCEA